jgi:hypothetical protein
MANGRGGVRPGAGRKRGSLVAKMNPRWTQFLDTLAKTAAISLACEAAGLSYTAVYLRRKRDSTFSAAMTEALKAYEATMDRTRSDVWLDVFIKGFEQGYAAGYVLRRSLRGMTC